MHNLLLCIPAMKVSNFTLYFYRCYMQGTAINSEYCMLTFLAPNLQFFLDHTLCPYRGPPEDRNCSARSKYFK